MSQWTHNTELMLGSTHQRIAQFISNELGITDKRKIGLLLGGSVHPDSWMDFPHHFGKDEEIFSNILQARNSYLQGDDECFHFLGIALHYIADRWTLRPRLSDKHTEWEKAIDNNPIVDDSKLKLAITEASIPTKIVEALVNFVDILKKGPSAIEGSTLTYAEKVCQFSTMNRPSNVNPIGGEAKLSVWSTPLVDLNFAYRICLEVSKAVLTPPPAEEPDFYIRGKNLQSHIAGFPDSYLGDNWNHVTLRQVSDISKIVEYGVWSNGGKFLETEIFIFDYEDLIVEEIKVPVEIKKSLRIKSTAGIFRKKEVEKEKTIVEIGEKTVYRVYLHTPKPFHLSRREIFLDCETRECADFILNRLRWVAENPNCPQRQSVRVILPGDNPNGSGDRGQRTVFIRWRDLVGLQIPIQENLEKIYRKCEIDKAELAKLKHSSASWF